MKTWPGPNQPQMQQLVDDLLAYNESSNTGCASIAFPGLPHKGIFMQHTQFDALLSSKESNCPAWGQYLEKDRDSLSRINRMDFYACHTELPRIKTCYRDNSALQRPSHEISDQNAGWTFTSRQDPVTVILTN